MVRRADRSEEREKKKKGRGEKGPGLWFLRTSEVEKYGLPIESLQYIARADGCSISDTKDHAIRGLQSDQHEDTIIARAKGNGIINRRMEAASIVAV